MRGRRLKGDKMKYEVCQKVMGLAETSCEQNDERNNAAAWNDVNARVFEQKSDAEVFEQKSDAEVFEQKSDAEQYRQPLINSYLSRYEQPEFPQINKKRFA
jgi:hypothetical protein